MALAPRRPCVQPKCKQLQPCPDHPIVAWRPRGSLAPTTRVRGRELQRRRAALFARSKWCVLCLKEGRQTRATIRDHIIPLAEGGRDDDTNVQPICASCSKTKTDAESARGAARARFR